MRGIPRENLASRFQDMTDDDLVTATAFIQARLQERSAWPLTDEWPDAIAPSRYVAMAIHTTRPEYQVHVKLRYEDTFGYIWESGATRKALSEFTSLVLQPVRPVIRR